MLINNVQAQLAWHFTPADVNALHSTAADSRLFYGADKLQFADLRLPKTQEPHPVAIIIHGGCWTSKFADLSNTAALSDALRNLGFATWNIEYRRQDNEGGGWPGTFDDIGDAADFLRNISSQYALDLNKVIVIGHSAGGHLALWLAGRHQLGSGSPLYKPNPLSLRGVIVLGGVPDLKAAREKCALACGMDVVGNLLGTNEEEINTHYVDVSPIHLLPLGVQQIFINGADDIAIPDEAVFDNYINKAKAAGDVIQLIRVQYAGHHEYNVPNSVAWPAVRAAAQLLVGNE